MLEGSSGAKQSLRFRYHDHHCGNVIICPDTLGTTTRGDLQTNVFIGGAVVFVLVFVFVGQPPGGACSQHPREVDGGRRVRRQAASVCAPCPLMI